MKYLVISIALLVLISSPLYAESTGENETVIINNKTLYEWRKKNGQDEKSKERKTLNDLKEDVKLLNLLNGLELSSEQMNFILVKAREAQFLRKNVNAQIKQNSQTLEKVLVTLKEDLAEGGNASSSQRKVSRAKHKVDELKDSLAQQINVMAQEVEGKLEGQQIYTLEHFIPCLIPPKEGNRAGQADSSKGFARQLERIKKIPSEHFTKAEEKIVARTLKYIRKHLPRGQVIDEDKERERIVNFFKEVRSLPETDFILQKEQLAEEFMSPYTWEKPTIDISVRIERFLLSSTIIPLLEEKLYADKT